MEQEAPLSGPRKELNAAVLIRRSLYVVLMLWLLWFYLGLDFRGLSTSQGMDQAQIAREIARGNGFETKKISPLALYQVNASKKTEDEHVPLKGFQDTYHAPLNPLLNSMVLRLVRAKWEFDRDQPIYYLDRVIIGVSAVLLMASVGISYLLVSRIFDTRIAAVTAVLLLLCEMLWGYTQSGLPHMLMLFLFTFSMYFLYKAVENAQLKRSPILWLVLCGGFMGLLALSKWLSIWTFIGLIIFVAFYFRPRGVNAFVLIGVFLLIVSPWAVRNYSVSGTPLGSGLYGAYNGLAGGSEGFAMRNFNPEKNPLPADGIFHKLISNSLGQLKYIYVNLGSIAVAPLFFLSLLHPFRRPEIAAFRWAILAMWLTSVGGMSIFGLTRSVLDPNQLNLLFIPLMTAYGLAFLSVLWTRTGLPTQYQLVRNGHFILVIALSAAPLMLTMPGKAMNSLRYKGAPHWPPYVPAYISLLGEWTDENEVIVADMPWAVAWYSDRISLWLPSNRDQFDELSLYSRRRGNVFAGLYFTPITINSRFATGIIDGEYEDWAQMITYGQMQKLGVPMSNEEFPFKYGQRLPIDGQVYFFTDSPNRLRLE